MALPHFYLDEQVLAREEDAVFPLLLAAEDAKHAHVLRLSAGEHIAVVDAAGDYFECELVSFDREGMAVRIAQKLDGKRSRPSVVLVQGIAKGEKMDGIIRHATELGVRAFIPWSCERSIVKLDAKKAAARTARWRSIAKSAAMQSGQPDVPLVCEPMSLDEVCAALGSVHAVLVCWEETTAGSICDEMMRALDAQGVSPEQARVAVVVGPEGGLAAREVEAVCAANPHAAMVSLGPSILRTETAGIVAPALALYDLGWLR